MIQYTKNHEKKFWYVFWWYSKKLRVEKYQSTLFYPFIAIFSQKWRKKRLESSALFRPKWQALQKVEKKYLGDQCGLFPKGYLVLAIKIMFGASTQRYNVSKVTTWNKKIKKLRCKSFSVFLAVGWIFSQTSIAVFFIWGNKFTYAS